MHKQYGAKVAVNGFLLTLLIASGAASAAMSLWLNAHRTIEFPAFPCTASVTYT